jgi:hypothetical protein
MNVSENELIGTIYSQLLEEFGFGYIEKDLWMIAENLSEKIANEQQQLNENQQTNMNRNMSKINDLAFELQHDDELTKEQWEKVEQIYKLSLMGDEEEE